MGLLARPASLDILVEATMIDRYIEDQVEETDTQQIDIGTVSLGQLDH